ncbi:MAG: 4Fe-4S binding protein [Candidatus Geothermarchaeales archaeon]
MAKLRVYEDYCKGCEICVRFCPMKVLAQSDRFNRRGYLLPSVVEPEKCTGCGICELLCPDFAIVVEGEEGSVSR